MKFIGFIAVFLSMVTPARASDRLPDLKPSKLRLFQTRIDTETVPGHKLLRFANATANVGDGPLELIGGIACEGRQEVLQRVYRDDGTFFDSLAGSFVFHPEHKHMHFENFVQFRLRKLNKHRGVGEIVTESEKTSYCVRDTNLHNPFKRHAKLQQIYEHCAGGVQGISVGWSDLYSKEVWGQWLDITDVPKGRYWLESEVNPDHVLLEKKFSNNITRRIICIK